MYIPNNDTQKYPFYRLIIVVETQLNEPTNQNPLKVPIIVKPTNKETLI